jgi:hypothetical protein
MMVIAGGVLEKSILCVQRIAHSQAIPIDMLSNCQFTVKLDALLHLNAGNVWAGSVTPTVWLRGVRQPFSIILITRFGRMTW